MRITFHKNDLIFLSFFANCWLIFVYCIYVIYLYDYDYVFDIAGTKEIN